MSEKLELYHLDLDISKVIEKASKSQQALEKLRLKVNELKKEQRATIRVSENYKIN